MMGQACGTKATSQDGRGERGKNPDAEDPTEPQVTPSLLVKWARGFSLLGEPAEVLRNLASENGLRRTMVGMQEADSRRRAICKHGHPGDLLLLQMRHGAHQPPTPDVIQPCVSQRQHLRNIIALPF